MDPYVYVDAFAGVECGVISAATSFHVVPFPATASGSQAMGWPESWYRVQLPEEVLQV